MTPVNGAIGKRTGSAAGFRFHFADETEASQLRPYLDAMVTRPDSLPGYSIKRKGKIRKSLTFRFQLGDRVVYCKRVPPKDLLGYAKDVFRPSRARNFWLQTQRIQQLGFGGPRLIAFGERKRGPVLLESILLCEEVANAEPLSEHLRRIVRGPGSRAVLWSFLRQLGEFVGRMHRQGVAHGDLRVNNLLVQREGAGVRFVLLDNDRTKVFRKIPENLRLRNLCQINLIFLPGLNLSDRVRFLHAYHEAWGGTETNWKGHVEQVVAGCEQRLQRYIRESDDLRGITAKSDYRGMMAAICRARLHD